MNQPRWLYIFNSVSTTNLRIVFTLFLALGTAVRHWITGEAVDSNWLIFLGALASVDAAQYASKRATFKGEAPVINGSVTLTTDIKELSEQKG